MNATTLNVQWNEVSGEQPLALLSSHLGLFSRLGVQQKVQRCPACDSIVYTRRHLACGVCGKELPSSFGLNVQESHNVEQLLREERQRHRAWLRRR